MGDENGTGTAEDRKEQGRLNTVVYVLALVILALAPSQYSFGGKDGIPHITPADAVLALTFAVWAGGNLISGRFRSMKLPPIELLLYLGWTLAVCLLTGIRGSLKEFGQLAAYLFCGALLFANLLREPRRLRAAVHVMMVAGTAVVLHALVQGLQGPLTRGGIPGNEQAIRALFINNHTLSGYLAMLAPMCIGILFFWPGRTMKIWAGVLAALSMLLVFNAGLLAAMVIAGAATAAVRGRRQAAAVLVSVLILLAVSLPLLPHGREAKLFSSVSIYTNWKGRPIVSYRYRRWDTGLRVFRSHPVTGVGPDRFQEHVKNPRYEMMDDGVTPTPSPPEDVTISKIFVDNRYILSAAELGLPGLLLLLGMFVLSCHRAVTAFCRAPDAESKGAMAACLGMLLAVSLGCIFTDFFVRGLAIPLVFASPTRSRREG